MSDQDVSVAFDELQELLSRPTEQQDPQAVAAWHEAFKHALATAEHGPQWESLQRRGKLMEAKLNEQVALLKAVQQTMVQEMGSQSTTRRALSAYSPARG